MRTAALVVSHHDRPVHQRLVMIAIATVIGMSLHTPARADDKAIGTGLIVGLNAIAWLGNGTAIERGTRSDGAAAYGYVIGTVSLGAGAVALVWVGEGHAAALAASGGLSILLATMNVMLPSDGKHEEKTSGLRAGNVRFVLTGTSLGVSVRF